MEDTDVVVLVNQLYKERGGVEGVIEFFLKNTIQVRFPPQAQNEFEGKIIFIKYLEHCREWKLWARQCRGLILGLIGGEWMCIKSLLQRGPEVFTGHHIDAGVQETQDFKIGRVDHLSEEHKVVISALLKDPTTAASELDPQVFLSMKRDGSLVGVHVYLFGSAIGDFVASIVRNQGDAFSQLFLQCCEEKALPFFVVVSTSGTLLVGDQMQDYVVTSILCGVFGVSYSALRERVKSSSLSPAEAISEKVGEFVDMINNFWREEFGEYERDPSVRIRSSPMCLSFEAICPQTTDAWGNVHTELAIGYNQASFTFLGVCVGIGAGAGTYLPHFSVIDQVQASNFSVPCFWETSSSKVSSMTHALSDTIQGKLTDTQFLELYPPSNPPPSNVSSSSSANGPPSNSIDSLISAASVTPSASNYVLDYEGFILFTRRLPLTPLSPSRDPYLYSKVKTPEYYYGHKIDFKKLDLVMALPPCFPIGTRVRRFYLNIEAKIARISAALSRSLDIITSAAVLDMTRDMAKTFSSSFAPPLDGGTTTASRWSVAQGGASVAEIAVVGGEAGEGRPSSLSLSAESLLLRLSQCTAGGEVRQELNMVDLGVVEVFASMLVSMGSNAKVLAAFWSKPRETQARMLINTSAEWRAVAREAVLQEFPAARDAESERLGQVVKAMCMQLFFWVEGAGGNEEHLRKMCVPGHALLAELFSLCSSVVS